MQVGAAATGKATTASVCVCRWAHIINLTGTESIHASCIMYCIHFLSRLSSPLYPSVFYSPAHPFFPSSAVILQPPGKCPTVRTFTADLSLLFPLIE